LIIEFVPVHDPQIQRLLTNRQDVSEDYTEEGFNEAFASHFVTVEEMPIVDTERKLFLMEQR
jgi:hypothetical protein